MTVLACALAVPAEISAARNWLTQITSGFLASIAPCPFPNQYKLLQLAHIADSSLISVTLRILENACE